MDAAVVAQIRGTGTIPEQYLLQELETQKTARLAGADAPLGGYSSKEQKRIWQQQRDLRRMNYVTATYFLLVKRKELEDLQRRQDEKSRALP